MLCGIDLAAKESNPTGLAFLEGKRVRTITVSGDDDIVEEVKKENPEIIAIDAPLTTRTDRYADIYLRRYGALSLKIPGMMALARRGLKISCSLREMGFEVIEVFPTATAKILGFYSRNWREMLPYFSEFEMTQVRNEHEMDTVIAAYTALLYKMGKVEIVDGVVIPSSPEPGSEG